MSRLGVAALLLAIAAAPAWAQDGDDGGAEERSYRLFGTWNVTYEDNQTDEDENEGYQKLKSLFGLNLVWWRMSAGIQLEYLDWSDPALVNPGDLDRLREGFELRKYWIEYLSDPFDARLGTFFTSFGHGMTLYVQKNEAVGYDEPIHGGTATLDIGRFELTALGGEVTEPLLSNRFGREFEDMVWGSSVRVELPADLYLGGSIVSAELESIFPGQPDDEADAWGVEAGGVELGGVLDVHAEWSELEQTERSRRETGHGGYLALSSTLGPVTLLGEYKDYWNFEYRYNNPPTAGSTLEQYAHDDVKGPRLMVTGDILATGTRIWGSVGDFDSHRSEDSLGGTDGDRQFEWYVGLEETTGPLYLEASYFDRDYRDRGVSQEHWITDVHFTTVGGRGDISAGYDSRREDLGIATAALDRYYLGFSLSPYGSITARYACDDKSTVGAEDYWGGEIEYFPIRAITIGLFVGSDPGGLVCSGGQCRVEPEFEGLRARFAWRF
ncbi:MAG: hypothetical protein C3F15_03595 [Holophagae bacterium]|nr:MAG: hypothetical protein C3F15_03595 [Holophagae bacterium]